jgi:hypothetical protein
MEIEQCEAADFFAAVPAQKIDQTVSGGHIGANRMPAPTAVMRQIASPTRRKRSSWMPFPV